MNTKYIYTYVLYPISILSVMTHLLQLGSFHFNASLFLLHYVTQYGNAFLKSSGAHCHNVKCKPRLRCDLFLIRKE